MLKIILLTALSAFIGLCAVGISPLASPALAQNPTPETAYSEAITSFHSDISINQDTSLTIREEIVYQTNQPKHGIYRYIPTYYNHDGFRAHLPVKLIAITDETGQEHPFTQGEEENNLYFKIGQAGQTFTGERTYIIEYEVARALNRLEDHDELYWDITGEGWQVPILSASATVSTEFGQMTRTACYSGRIGGDDGLCQISPAAAAAETNGAAETNEANETNQTSVTFTYPQTIAYNDNLTVAIAFAPDNQFNFPGPIERASNWLTQNWSFLILPLPLISMFIWWWFKGRDWQFVSANVFDLDQSMPQHRRPPTLKAREPLVYEPLKDLSPGEAGALINEKVDNQNIVAEILELARKKYLKIEATSKKKLFGKKTDYQFTKLDSGRGELTPTQQYLYDELFKGNRKTTSVEKLRGSFSAQMKKAGELLNKSLMEKQVFSLHPTHAKMGGIVVAMILGTGSIILVGSQLLPVNIIWPFLIALAQMPLLLILGANMPQKTALGTNLWLQSRGLRKSIRAGLWREKIKEKNLFIEEVLPFAVSLGVVKELSKQMEELNIAPPDYLGAASMGVALNTSDFVSGFSKEVGSGLSYNPSSSSSGSGGFSGGSSGGGGGGGGGGSW